ncbi:hypothetical protein PV740_39135 [Streptomyces europaeiscabiei]|nr:hypothetical protein [Streptomyces europaeiscabiei]
MKCVICGSPDAVAWGSYKPSPACHPCHCARVDTGRVRLGGTPTCLYRLYDVFGTLLYLGISSDLKRRWKEHRTSSWWWPQVIERREEWFDDRPTAHAAEGHAVRTELPLHNSASWGDFTDGQRPTLPPGISGRPSPPDVDGWWHDQAAVGAYQLLLEIWRAQLRDAALSPDELKVVLAGRTPFH